MPNSYITSSRISTIIQAMIVEYAARYGTSSDISIPASETFVNADLYSIIIGRNNVLNEMHHNPAADITTHKGLTQTGVTLTASSLDFTAGIKIKNLGIQKIKDDIGQMVAQCDCDTYCQEICNCNQYVTCSCELVCGTNVYCGCQNQGCNNSCNNCGHSTCDCNANCPSHNVCACNWNWLCQCNAQDCSCNQMCTCNGNCACNSQCTCNLYCTCNTQCPCNSHCDCNSQCSCDLYTTCNCVSNCTCNKVCNCEFT